ncbi:MAG: hypothetical protein WAN34_02495 [Acidimicrobiia bacterium]
MTPSGRVVVVVGSTVVVVVGSTVMVVVVALVGDVVVALIGDVVVTGDEPPFSDVIEHAVARRMAVRNTTRRIVIEVASAWALILRSGRRPS